VTCPECIVDTDCNDGVSCTVDACNEATGFCNYTPFDAVCDNGQFCDGPEVCYPDHPEAGPDGCAPGDPPCPPEDCDEENDACPSEAPIVEAGGGRYLAVTPQPPTSSTPVALVVTYCSGSTSRYVGYPTSWDIDGDGTNDAKYADLVPYPHMAAYRTPAEWGGTVYVTGTDIVPSTEYQVQADSGAPGSPYLTDPVFATTWDFGDVVPPYNLVTIDDVLALVNAFQGIYHLGQQPTKPMMDVEGLDCSPDHDVFIGDVLYVVWAFQGYVYTDTSCPLPCER
jgi:hypothetical protein